MATISMVGAKQASDYCDDVNNRSLEPVWVFIEIMFVSITLTLGFLAFKTKIIFILPCLLFLAGAIFLPFITGGLKVTKAKCFKENEKQYTTY